MQVCNYTLTNISQISKQAINKTDPIIFMFYLFIWLLIIIVYMLMHYNFGNFSGF